MTDLLIQQAISLFDLLPCRTTELQIAGDWLEDHGLYSFIADVVRNGRWSSIKGIVSEIVDSCVINFYGSGRGCGYGYGHGSGHGSGYGTSNGAGAGNGTGRGDGYGRGYGHGAGHGAGAGNGTGHGAGKVE